jgi:pimeloyl-ACP methyl ester carboxylesterase
MANQTTTRFTPSAPRIAHDDAGSGEPALLLLPGWCGPRTMFRDVITAHARHRRVLAMDLRGHGESEPGAGPIGYAELLDDILRLLDGAGVERVIPVGVAHAGWAAIDLRRRLGPERVPGVVFLDWMVLGAPPPFMEALDGLRHPAYWSAVRDRLFQMWTTGVALPALDALIGEMGRADGALWRRAAVEIGARFAADPVPLAVLAAQPIPCPTLHLYAQPAAPEFLAAQQAFAAANSWFSVEKLAGASHFPTLESPREVVAQVERFARTLTPAVLDGRATA